jgi:hypothetical protein
MLGMRDYLYGRMFGNCGSSVVLGIELICDDIVKDTYPVFAFSFVVSLNLLVGGISGVVEKFGGNNMECGKIVCVFSGNVTCNIMLSVGLTTSKHRLSMSLRNLAVQVNRGILVIISKSLKLIYGNAIVTMVSVKAPSEMTKYFFFLST